MLSRRTFLFMQGILKSNQSYALPYFRNNSPNCCFNCPPWPLSPFTSGSHLSIQLQPCWLPFVYDAEGIPEESSQHPPHHRPSNARIRAASAVLFVLLSWAKEWQSGKDPRRSVSYAAWDWKWLCSQPAIMLTLAFEYTIRFRHIFSFYFILFKQFLIFDWFFWIIKYYSL